LTFESGFLQPAFILKNSVFIRENHLLRINIWMCRFFFVPLQAEIEIDNY